MNEKQISHVVGARLIVNYERVADCAGMRSVKGATGARSVKARLVLSTVQMRPEFPREPIQHLLGR